MDDPSTEGQAHFTLRFDVAFDGIEKTYCKVKSHD
jgi:hypothetical protein